MSDSSNKKKGRISLILRIAIAAGALYLVFRGENIRELWQTLISINPLSLIAAFLLYWLGQVIFVYRWRSILSVQNVKLSILDGFKLHMMGLFYNNCLPSAVGGDILRAWYVTRHAPEGKRVEAAFSVIMDRFVGLTGMIAMALVAFAFAPPISHKPENHQTAAAPGPIQVIADHRWLIFGVFAGLVLAAGGALCIKPLRKKFFHLAVSAWQKGWHLAHKCLTAAKLYFKKPLTIFVAYLLTFFNQSVQIIALYIIGKSLQMDVDIKYYFIFFPISWMIGAVPISIGGIGFMEGWLKIAFSQLPGVSTTQAAAIGIFQRILWLFGSLPGVIVHLSGAHLPRQKEEFFIDDIENLT